MGQHAELTEFTALEHMEAGTPAALRLHEGAKEREDLTSTGSPKTAGPNCQRQTLWTPITWSCTHHSHSWRWCQCLLHQAAHASRMPLPTGANWLTQLRGSGDSSSASCLGHLLPYTRYSGRPDTCQDTSSHALQRESYKDLVHTLRLGLLPWLCEDFRLEPFLDVNGINQVGSGLLRADIDRDALNLPFLPRDHAVMTLIIHRVHRVQAGHIGREHMTGSLREKYWIS